LSLSDNFQVIATRCWVYFW